MVPDKKLVESLVEIITREVLLEMAEQDVIENYPDGSYCVSEIADGVRVKTGFDNAGHVISAGAERIASTVGVIPDDLNLAKKIDHTLLKPDATPDQIAQLCFEARKYGFASVCVNPAWIKLCADLLKGTEVKVCSVVGFPLGATPPEVKVFETEQVIKDGATEIDMVINIGALKAGDTELVARDIRGIVETAHRHGAIVKVIIEVALLTDEEKVIASLLSKEAGADFVKTSTGFASSGATVRDVELMRRTVGPEMGVKAAGGVRTREDAENMVKAGATRLGASAGVKIVQTGNVTETKKEAPTATKGY
jgi:deoxyribose-phosphate aldolase